MYVSKVAEKISEPHHVGVDESGNEKKERKRNAATYFYLVLYVFRESRETKREGERDSSTHLRRL